jgi:hypothetical protein
MRFNESCITCRLPSETMTRNPTANQRTSSMRFMELAAISPSCGGGKIVDLSDHFSMNDDECHDGEKSR